MARKIIEADLVKVLKKNNQGKLELLAMLAWGDEVDLEDDGEPGFHKIKTEYYVKQEDGSYKKEVVPGLIKKTTKLGNPADSKVLKVSFVDVQQGDGIHIETPKGRKILIDGGDNPLFARYLASRYKGTLKDSPLLVDAMVVTHGDADHFLGLTEIYKSQNHDTPYKKLFLRPRRIFHNGIVKGPSSKNGKSVPVTKVFGTTEAGSGGRTYLTDLVDNLLEVNEDRLNKPFKSWVSAIKGWKKNGNDDEPIVIKRLQYGDDDEFSFLSAENINIKVLGPFTENVNGKTALPLLHEPPKTPPLEVVDELKDFDKKEYSASHTINGHSIVMQLRYGNVHFLFTGDLNEESENILETLTQNNQLDLRSEIFKVPHHGSADFSPSFISAVSPVVSVISSGDESAKKEYIHPRATLVGSLGKHSRLSRPLIFVTELVAFFEVMGYARLTEGKKPDGSGDPSKKKGKTFFGFKREQFGIVHVRTDGTRVLVYTNSGRKDMKEAYAFKVAPDGKITPDDVVKG